MKELFAYFTAFKKRDPEFHEKFENWIKELIDNESLFTSYFFNPFFYKFIIIKKRIYFSYIGLINWLSVT